MSTTDKKLAALDADKLHQLPPGWSWVRVVDVADVKLGRQRSPEHHNGSHMRPYLRVANVYENRIDVSDVLTMNFTPEEFETYQLQYGDILLNEGQSLRWVGRPAIYRDELPGACFQNTLVRFRSSEAVLPKYALMVFLHYLHCQRFQQIAKWTVNIAHLGAARFAVIEFPLAPINEQQRIADALDELLSDLDAGVAALERVQAKLKHYRAAVLKAAVEGALTAEWRAQHPATEPASALLTRILAERRRRWEEAQLQKFKEAGKEPPKDWKAKYKEPVEPDTICPSPFPVSWCLVKVDHLLAAPITNGISVRGSDEPPGIPALRLNAMSERGFDYALKRYLPLKPSDVDDLWIKADDFFVSRGNGSKHLVGRGTFAQTPPEKIIFPDTMMRLRFLKDCLALRWISTIWGSGFVRKQVERIAKTTAGIYKISQPDLAGVRVPLPPLAEQEAIVEAVEDQLSVIEHLEADLAAKLKSAQALRQSILRHAFTGQLVPQDPQDEPAAELLKRIAAQREERARLLKAAKPAKKSPTAPRGRKKATP